MVQKRQINVLCCKSYKGQMLKYFSSFEKEFHINSLQYYSLHYERTHFLSYFHCGLHDNSELLSDFIVIHKKLNKYEI